MSDPEELSSLTQEQRQELLLRLLNQTKKQSRTRFPLSFAQQRLWVLDQMEGETSAYSVPTALRLRGPLDPGLLERSFGEVIKRHQVLRTTFEANADTGAPEQVIHPWSPVALEIIDLSGSGDDGKLTQARELANQEAQRPFSLSTGPLLRASLLRLEAEDHILLLVIHHIVSDMWSTEVLTRELTLLYEAFARGEDSPLPQLPIQYADFAHWQRNRMKGELLEKLLAYWRNQLAGELPALELPTRGARPARHTLNGAEKSWRLGPDTTRRLTLLSRQEGATLFMTLLAAFKVLLCRYTGQDDVIVGTPIANRGRSEVEGLIGLFINTLVLRTSLAGDPTFKQLLSRERETALGAYSNQDVPFEKLVEELQPRRDLSRTPIFQVLFALQNVPRAEERIQDLSITSFPLDVRTAKFDLTVTLLEDENGLLGAWEYNTDLFEESLIERMTGHFERLLESIAADPARRISDLPLLSEAERQHLLGSPQDLATNDPRANSLHELFEAQVQRTPDAAALTFKGETLTYRELNRRADRLAKRLRAAGVAPEVLVGIAAERSMELVVGLLAILKAGGAYVPLDPAYPRDRLAFVLEDAGIRVLLTQETMLDQLPDHRATVLCLDETALEEESDEREVLQPVVTGENLAYVIYTSGSTGKPKGVLVTHANVIRLFTTTQRWFDFGPADVWTLFHSHAFDFSVWELWGPLLYGGRLVVVPYVVSRSPESFYELLRSEDVTVLNQTPSAFRQLMQVDGDTDGRAHGGGCLALRSVIFGGEALDIAGLKPWFDRHGDESPQLINMYGITETTVHVTYRPLRMADSANPASLIGVPIPDLQVYVLDRHLQPAPIDVAGEIYVGGSGVSRGYLNRPSLAAERFIPDPYGAPGARLYRTGDSARRLANGDLEYMGRVDQQVKIRGFRIELGEIEATLVGSSQVRDAVVIARNSAGDERQLAAYIVPQPGVAPNIPELRGFMKTKLPDYMIPAQFICLDKLPLTANGKIDRRALPEPEAERPHLGSAFVEPLTPAQTRLANIWAEVLQINSVGIDDNFFELGGDSIRTVQVVSKARREGLNISIQELFEHQTIRELADSAQSEQATDKRIVEPFALLSEEDRRRVPDSIEDAYPMTMLQSGMLFHSALDPKAAVYHNVGSYHLRAPLDSDLMGAAIDRLLARHPVLRTSFDLVSFSEPMQLVHRSVFHATSIEDLRNLSSADQDEAVRNWIEAEKQHAFDWTEAPLLRFHIHRRSEHTFQFGMTEHHAILDGWSVASALVELFQIYFSLLEGRAESPEPPGSTSFRDFVIMEREALASDECRGYWRTRLAESTVMALPRWPLSDSSDNELPVHSLDVPISLETAEGLNNLARSEQIPLKSVLLAAHLKVMSLLSGQPDVITGVVTHGRPEGSDGESALGLFLNTIPFRQVLSKGTWAELAKRVFNGEREFMPFRRYQMAQMQRDNGSQPLFETVFNYTNFHVLRNLEQLGNLEVLDSSLFAQTDLMFWANFSVDTSTAQLRLALSADSSQLRREQLESMSGYYARALEAMALTPYQDFSSCNLMSDQERHQVLFGWNDCAVEYRSADSVSRLFEAQVEESPDELALIGRTEQLTYRALNLRANQLARHLRTLGAGPETPVGVCAERSTDLVVALLAILKSGAAYVPLDAAYPRERLDFMLDDADASILVTNESLANELRAPSRRLVLLDSDVEEIGKHSGANLDAGALPENPAYVIYTSGSTGVPKGVAIEHRSAIAFLNWARDTFSAAELARTVASTSICFDLSVFEIFCPLISGGTVILVENILQLPEGEDHRPTLINTVPSAMAELVRLGTTSSVRTVNLAGEPLRDKLAQQVYGEDGVRRVYNLYGPSEDTTYSTIELIEKGALNEPTIGRPISNTQTFVLDDMLEPCPVGVAGQLHISGEGLARGYLKRPPLTAEKFIPHPFSSVPGARLYGTGDLARYLPDGRIDFLGRIDHQVKIRGFRIELGEIEAVMGGHTEISESAVLSSGESTNNLTCYAVRRAGGSVSADQLRAYLRVRLPDYMVPASFAFLDRLPLTPNGKVDRRELSRVGTAFQRDERSIVAPRDSLELQLTRIWETVLNIRPISVTDNFFDMGGHSLLAVRVVAQVREKLKRPLPLSALVRGASIESLARLLREERPVAAGSLVALQPGGSRPPFFSVHPIGGSVLCYMEVARSLDSDRPFYGFEAAALEDDIDDGARIETIAATYIQELRSVQPEGPYLLGGWSFGGVVAFEMARQLTGQDRSVAAVVLLDTWAPLPKGETPAVPDSAELVARFADDIAGISGKKISADLDHLRRLDAEAQLKFILDEALRLDVLSRDMNLEQFTSLFGVFARNAKAYWAYAPPRQNLRVPLVLFRAREGKEEGVDGFALGWDKAVDGSVEVRAAEGDHYTMLRGENGRSLARRLKEYLDGIGETASPAESLKASTT